MDVRSLKVLGGVALFWAVSSCAQAASFTINYQRITSNSASDVAGQLLTRVADKVSALSLYNVAIASDELLFTFSNNVGTASNISEVYFDDNGFLLSQTAIRNSMAGFTDFGSTLNPSNLPSGNTISFSATNGFGADASGNPDNGVNTATDLLGIVVKMAVGNSLTQVANAMASDSLRLGLHVRSIGTAGKSDSFASVGQTVTADNPIVPVPGAVWLFATGLAALISGRRTVSA